MIETARGPCRVDQLRPADLVQTLDDGYCPVTWVRSDHRSLDGVSPRNTASLLAVIVSLNSTSRKRPLCLPKL